MIGLAEKLPGHDERYELHRLLGALLSKELTIDEKLNIIGTEYDIPIGENLRKDVSHSKEQITNPTEARQGLVYECKSYLFYGRYIEVRYVVFAGPIGDCCIIF